MSFEILGDITNVETIVIGNSIREIKRLRKVYGPGRWRKLKGLQWFAFLMVLSVKLKYIGTKPMELEKRK